MTRSLRHMIFFVACLAAQTALAEGEPPIRCYSTKETRAEIAEHNLVEPFALMRAEGRRLGGEAIAVRLCRTGDSFVYEVSVLKGDGVLVRTMIDAAGETPAAAGGR